MKRILLIGIAILHFGPHPCIAQSDSVYVRVIDVGPGLATVVKMPGDFYMVYDAGHWNGEGSRAFAGISDVIPPGEEIYLMVLSHSDSDHQGAVKRIFDAYTVKKIIRGGLERTGTQTWVRADSMIGAHAAAGTTEEINLKTAEFPPGRDLQIRRYVRDVRRRLL